MPASHKPTDECCCIYFRIQNMTWWLPPNLFESMLIGRALSDCAFSERDPLPPWDFGTLRI